MGLCKVFWNGVSAAFMPPCCAHWSQRVHSKERGGPFMVRKSGPGPGLLSMCDTDPCNVQWLSSDANCPWFVCGILKYFLNVAITQANHTDISEHHLSTTPVSELQNYFNIVTGLRCLYIFCSFFLLSSHLDGFGKKQHFEQPCVCYIYKKHTQSRQPRGETGNQRRPFLAFLRAIRAHFSSAAFKGHKKKMWTGTCDPVLVSVLRCLCLACRRLMPWLPGLCIVPPFWECPALREGLIPVGITGTGGAGRACWDQISIPLLSQTDAGDWKAARWNNRVGLEPIARAPGICPVAADSGDGVLAGCWIQDRDRQSGGDRITGLCSDTHLSPHPASVSSHRTYCMINVLNWKYIHMTHGVAESWVRMWVLLNVFYFRTMGKDYLSGSFQLITKPLSKTCNLVRLALNLIAQFKLDKVCFILFRFALAIVQWVTMNPHRVLMFFGLFLSGKVAILQLLRWWQLYSPTLSFDLKM